MLHEFRALLSLVDLSEVQLLRRVRVSRLYRSLLSRRSIVRFRRPLARFSFSLLLSVSKAVFSSLSNSLKDIVSLSLFKVIVSRSTFSSLRGGSKLLALRSNKAARSRVLNLSRSNK